MELIRETDYRKEPVHFLRLEETWDLEKFPTFSSLGDRRILQSELLAVFCSRKCPGSVITTARELVGELGRKGVPVIGGFQTPVEKMCLELFIKQREPVVVCPARGIRGMRIPAEWVAPIEEGRLLVVSPFSTRHRRVSRSTAELRNRFVAAAAGRILFLHAAPNSRTLAFAGELLQAGRDVEAVDLPANTNLVSLGAAVRKV